VRERERLVVAVGPGEREASCERQGTIAGERIPLASQTSPTRANVAAASPSLRCVSCAAPCAWRSIATNGERSSAAGTGAKLASASAMSGLP